MPLAPTLAATVQPAPDRGIVFLLVGNTNTVNNPAEGTSNMSNNAPPSRDRLADEKALHAAYRKMSAAKSAWNAVEFGAARSPTRARAEFHRLRSEVHDADLGFMRAAKLRFGAEMRSALTGLDSDGVKALVAAEELAAERGRAALAAAETAVDDGFGTADDIASALLALQVWRDPQALADARLLALREIARDLANADAARAVEQARQAARAVEQARQAALVIHNARVIAEREAAARAPVAIGVSLGVAFVLVSALLFAGLEGEVVSPGVAFAGPPLLFIFVAVVRACAAEEGFVGHLTTTFMLAIIIFVAVFLGLFTVAGPVGVLLDSVLVTW